MPVAVRLPKVTVSTIKDTIYIVGIVITLFFYFRDKAVKQAVLETKFSTIIENQNNILNKFKENDLKWEGQKEINGQFTMYIKLDTPK